MSVYNGFEFNTIVAFPYSSNVELGANNQPQPVLSLLSRMSLDAAGCLFEQAGDKPGFLPLGEIGYPGLKSTAELMAERAESTAGIPEGSILPRLDRLNDVPLNNTNLQVEALAEFTDHNPDSRILAVALKYHVARVNIHASGYSNLGSRIHVVPAEKVLRNAGKLGPYEKYLKLIDSLLIGETFLAGLSRVQPTGGVINVATKIRGARMMDIVDGPNGKPQLVSTTCQSRLRELIAEAGS